MPLTTMERTERIISKLFRVECGDISVLYKIMAWIRKLAIDLGTSNCFVWSGNEGVILSEPSVVAIEAESHKVLAACDEAKKM